MGAVLRFVAWVLGQAWKYGGAVATKVAAWAQKNWRTVYRWILGGVAWGTILESIMKALGLK